MMRNYNAEEIKFMLDHCITEHQFNYMDDMLQNNHDIPDHNLKIEWLSYGIKESIISIALKLRSQFLTDPFCELGINKNGLKTADMCERLAQH